MSKKQKSVLNHLILLSWSGTSAWQSRALLYVNTPDKRLHSKIQGKNRDYTQCVWTIINAGRCSALKWVVDEWRHWDRTETICFGHSSKVSFTGVECVAVRRGQLWRYGVNLKPSGEWASAKHLRAGKIANSLRTKHRSEHSRAWAEPKTAQIRENNNNNTSTNTYALTQCK